ncbi:YceI family protein [Limibaculum sp. M0105]|uniref:YceI family protein n=1 Tax=Thermohalobaculum xanthum TaxID=2753746 RepID=A0A8J7SH08_9RHOB|nr:YceI family protein [Thermohalobaculum xanthum]MBK0399380.1 YceI family protein [Thermohalobaculum xanthum]
MKFQSLALAAAFALGAVLPAAAEPHVLDKSHASITFQVDHLGFSTVHGKFREFDAQIEFDPEKVEDTRLRFVVMADSIDTGWGPRDDHLKTGDFFAAAENPEIVFESTSVTPTGSDTADVAGTLTMKGASHPVTFMAKLNKLGPSPFDPSKTIAGFTATGEIDRTKFGMDYAAPAVSAVIPVRIDLEMSPAN